MKKLSLIFFAITIITTTGCRSFTSPARNHSLDSSKDYWLDYDATRRGALITFDNSGKAYMLAEPSPDVALELTQKYLAKINYKEIQGEGSLELAENIVQLGKRSTTIQFLRDSLYRMAELANNDQLSAEKIALFKQTLDATITLANAELKQAEAKKSNADAKKLEKIQKLKELKLKDELKGISFSNLSFFKSLLLNQLCLNSSVYIQKKLSNQSQSANMQQG